MAAWSLQGPKNVSGGEGGIFTANNEEFYYRALLLGHYNKGVNKKFQRRIAYLVMRQREWA